MGKGDFMTPKAIANRQKAKGLQKLRWYCQMCGKQCRDENGFKCHLSSESHRRQMALFGEAPDEMVADFSARFEAAFLDLMRRTHPFSRVPAQLVYNQYIADKDHVHMNATRWHTLTDFVAHLGRSGVCRVDETEAGLHIALVAGDAAKEAAAAARAARDKAERDEAARAAAAVAAQAARAAEEAAKAGKVAAPAVDHELKRGEGDTPVKLAVVRGPGAARPAAAAAFGDDDDDQPTTTTTTKRARLTKAEELMARETAAKKARQEEEAADAKPASTPWIAPHLVVKLIARSLRDAGLYKAKAVVTAVDGHVATVATIDTGAVVRVDETDLETVLPAVGGRVQIVRGARAGAAGTLTAIDEAGFRARVAVEGGEDAWYEYDDICRVKSRA